MRKNGRLLYPHKLIDKNDTEYYLITDQLDGNLQDLIDRRVEVKASFTIDEVIGISIQIIEGLLTLHRF